MSAMPSPKSLLLEAKGAVPGHAPVDLFEYTDVIVELRRKNHSFAKIADWLSQRLGRPINKGSVYRVYTEWAQREELDPSALEESSPEQSYEQAVDEMALRLVELADAYEKENECRGLARSALERASLHYAAREADERAAEDEDTSTSSAPETTKG